jgi:hypothetical protein
MTLTVKTQNRRAETIGLQMSVPRNYRRRNHCQTRRDCNVRSTQRLSELADYRKSYGHCNVPRRYSEKNKLATWVAKQRAQYKLHLKGKASSMTLSRIQELESLGFEWDRSSASTSSWEDRLSELVDYRKIQGHCNIPPKGSENTKLGNWVTTQRSQYRLHAKGKTSHMTTVRIQELESLGFEWAGDRYGVTATWEDRLSELSDYRKINGHCNVP